MGVSTEMYVRTEGGLPRIMCDDTMIVPEPEAVTDASHYTSLVERLAFGASKVAGNAPLI